MSMIASRGSVPGRVRRHFGRDLKREIELEIAHVLFIDIVGYSKLSTREQNAAVGKLTQIVPRNLQKCGSKLKHGGRQK